jgi:hypothetical protein
VARRPSLTLLWSVPIVTGVLLGTVRQVRSEPVLIVAAAVFAYLSFPRTAWRHRIVLVALLVAALGVTSWAWRQFFDWKFAQAQQIVAGAGGHPYPGPRDRYHHVWHPIWCGLGDFDTKYGYRWDDRAAAAYARPILRRMYGADLPTQRAEAYRYEDAFWDAAGKYYKVPQEMPGYDAVVREKVLHDISRDPVWYAGILGRRVWRVLSVTTPVRLTAGPVALKVPMHGAVVPVMLIALLLARCWLLAKLVIFLVPLSLSAVVVYSDRGMTYYSGYHLMAAAIFSVAVLEGLAWVWRRRRNQQPSSSFVPPATAR